MTEDWDLEAKAITLLETAHQIFLPGEGDKGLLPRTKICLGKALIPRESRLKYNDLEFRGLQLRKERIDMGWRDKSIRIVADDEDSLNKLVKPTYW